MRNFVLSPCIIKDTNGEYIDNIETLNNFHNVLVFADKWLDLKLLIHEQSLYKNLWAYQPPLTDQTLASFFASNITPRLQSLIADGDVVTSDVCDIKFESESYLCADQNECNLIAYCLKMGSYNEILMFVGELNRTTVTPVNVELGGDMYELKLLSDPYKDETGTIDEMVKIPSCDPNAVFPCSKVCCYYADKTKTEKNEAAYHKYGEIIAKRNGYTKMPFDSRRYKQNVPSYVSKDGKYYISLDDLHGTFEVFNAKTKNADYMGEYDFKGELISSKTSKAQTHKFFK